MNYYKLGLVNEWLSQTYATFKGTLDTADYVPEDYNLKILKGIFKDVKRIRRRLDAEDRAYQRIERIKNAPVRWLELMTAKVESREAMRQAHNIIKSMKQEIRAKIKSERNADREEKRTKNQVKVGGENVK